MEAHPPSWGQAGKQRARHRGQGGSWEGRGLAQDSAHAALRWAGILRGLQSLLSSDPFPTMGSRRLGGGGSRPSHLMVCVVCVPLFFSSVFKKIFCQGEPLGHQLLALGLAAAALPGWQVAVAARVEKLGSWERLFPFGSPQAGSLEPG